MKTLPDCPDCGEKATTLYSLQLTLDGVYRCPECAGRWELRQKGRSN